MHRNNNWGIEKHKAASIRKKVSTKDVPASTIKNEDLADNRLGKLPNDLNGEKRLQRIKELIDASQRQKSTQITDRLHWKNKPVLTQRHRQLAPISPSGALGARSITAKSSMAMAIGIVMKEAHAGVLYQIVKEAIVDLAKVVHKDHPETAGCTLSVAIKYLKVAREYGKAPQLLNVTLDQTIPTNAQYDLNPVKYISDKVSATCNTSLRAPISHKYQKVHGELGEGYSTALLFVKCIW